MLALLGLTLLEGVRRVPQGAVTAFVVGLSSWKVNAPPAATSRARLVSWTAPLSLHVVLPPTPTPARPAGLRRRWRRVRQSLLTIRLLSTVDLLALVIGVPAATARWGVRGMVVALVEVVALTAVVVIESAAILRETGLPRRAVWRAVRGLVSPFAAPHASEVVIETALADVSQLVALQLLLPAEEFAAWVRPRAYDSLQVGAADDRELDAVLSPSARRSLVETAPSAHAYCPRCGTEYRVASAMCTDCHDVPLRQPAAGSPVAAETFRGPRGLGS
ncbi:MAG TPA: hypothetical protein VEU55_03365 [Gemmatimonadales bacterium]|nr:hypothetical protein [Gemmatimonadales bacterium]